MPSISTRLLVAAPRAVQVEALWTAGRVTMLLGKRTFLGEIIIKECLLICQSVHQSLFVLGLYLNLCRGGLGQPLTVA